MLLSASGGNVCVGTDSRDDNERTINLCVESSSIFWKLENRVENKTEVAAGSVKKITKREREEKKKMRKGEAEQGEMKERSSDSPNKKDRSK